MWTMMRSLAVAMLLIASSTATFATGTVAETPISNTASVSYSVNAVPVTQNSNTVTITVSELLGHTLTWQDATNIIVRPGDTDQVTTFRLTNVGNGDENFLLSADNAIAAGDEFDLSGAARIYLDSDGDNSFDISTDTLYNSTTNIPTLAPDAAITLFVLNDIPGDPGGPADGDTAINRLTADAQTGIGAPGTVFPNAGGSGSVNAIVGSNGGTENADGIYQVSRINVSLVKTYTISDLLGGSEPTLGATITYSIVISVTGSGTATDLAISDPIPASTTYVAGSLTLDATALTDNADTDSGEVIENPVGSGNYQFDVRLGDLTGGATHTVTFDTTID